MRRKSLGSFERQARQTEALLLLFVLAVLGLGAVLVTSAKGRVAPTTGVVRVNTADAETLSRALGVPRGVGEQLMAERKRRSGGGFPDVDSLGRVPLVTEPSAAADALTRAGLAPATAARQQVRDVLGGRADAAAVERLLALRDKVTEGTTWQSLLRQPLVSPTRLRAAEARLVVRDWSEARRTFFLWCGGLAAFLVVAHIHLRRVRPKADPFLLPVVGLLSTLGLLMLFSIKDPVRDMPTYALQAQALLVGGGVALLVALSGWFGRLPLHRYGYLYAVGAVLLTVLLGVFGSGPGGVRLSLAGTQPVEIIKLLLVFFLAAYLAERGPLLNDPLRKIGPFPLPRRKDAAPLIVLYALPLALFALIKDLGPVLLLFGAFLLLIYLATGRGVYVALGLVALAVGGFVGYRLGFGVFETRVDMWLSPWQNGHKRGDHLALSLWGLASGGPFGSGLGMGAPGTIPRGGSDLIFATLGEELGLAGTLVVIACFLVVIARGLRIARRAGSDFDRLLAAGLSGLLALQAAVLIAGTLGVLPMAGITLPFVAYGKSSLVTSFFAVGVLLLVSARVPGVAVAPPRSWDAAAARVAAVFGLFFVGVLVAGRLVWVQALRADRVAARLLRVPDADGVTRAHVNPRLSRVASKIPRGRLLDRADRVLAETRTGRRFYPYGPATAQLVGYADPSVGGPAGLEARFDRDLRGYGGWDEMVPLWRAKDLPGFRLPAGKDVRVTLDAELQKVALAAFDRGTERSKRRGAVVVLDVATGGVLAAATRPTFDPNGLTPARLRELSANVAGDFPLINRALGGYYPPGSTFKIVTASALFAAGRADFTHACGHVATNVLWTAGGGTYGRRRIVDDEGERAHGLVNLTEGVVESCNIYFALAGIALGPDTLRTQAERFGFTRLPSPRQFGEDLPDIAYGQGPILATPLEMANVARTVAAGGRRVDPTFLTDAGRPPAGSAVLTPDDAARLADMMRRVTISGTAAGRFDELSYGVAGKTGTAQNEENDRKSHSWFIGFAPVERPQVAFAVIAENAGYGAAVAVPITRDVLRALRLSAPTQGRP